MESAALSSNHKRRSLFMKSKLLSNSFSKVVTKPFTAINHHGSGKGKPLPTPVWMDSSKHSNYAFTPAVRSASATISTANANTKQGNPNISATNVCYGSVADENVDKKAACYIFNVRERFNKMDRFDWDQNNKHHEVH